MKILSVMPQTKRRGRLFLYLVSTFFFAALLGLPQMAQRALAKQAVPRMTQTGWVSLIWSDPKPRSGARPELLVYLNAENARPIRLLINPALAKRYDGIHSLAQQRISVAGRMVPIRTVRRSRAPLEMGLQVETLRVVGSAPPRSLVPVRKPRRISGRAHGATKTVEYVTILLRFSDTTGYTPQTPDWYAKNLFQNTYPGQEHYWSEMTYGDIRYIAPRTYGWYNLPQNRAYYTNATGTIDTGRLFQDAVAVSDADINFAEFAGINMMVNDRNFNSALGGYGFTNADGPFRRMGLTWMPEWGHNPFTMGHEVGHSLGLPHSSGPTGTVYASDWDVMSGGFARDPQFGNVPVHTIAPYKDLIAPPFWDKKDSWMPPTRKFLGLGGVSRTIQLSRLALPSSNQDYLEAQIFIGGSATDFYTVEARRVAGYDSQGGLPGQAVIIHRVDTTRNEPAWVVAANGSSNANGADAMWLPGETFTDQANAVSIRVDSATATGFTVTINVGPDVPWPNMVTKTAPSGPGSLRNAIIYANMFPDTASRPDIVPRFNIPTTDAGYSNGVFTIRPNAGLPPIKINGFVLDGSSQTAFTGDTNTSGPEIVINGADAGSAEGIQLRASSAVVRNVAINGFSFSGISIAEGASSNTIQNCYLGVNAAGNAASANRSAGILIYDGATNNTVGGLTAGAGNLIAGNTFAGVGIFDPGTTGNLVQSNLIGTDRTATAAIANNHGVVIAGGATNNVIGGTTLAARNIISGNTVYGIALVDPDTSANAIQNNFIGTNATAAAALPNQYGLLVGFGAQNNLIGGVAPGAGNVVSGNTRAGVVLNAPATTGNFVQGNWIGTNPTGAVALPNREDGVLVLGGAQSNTIGGTSVAARNVISGNGRSGVGIFDQNTTGNLLQGNRIGTDPTGNAILANGQNGVTIGNGAANNRIGGTTPGAANVISGNNASGVSLSGSATTGNVVDGNVIGANAGGTAALSNRAHGVLLGGAARSNTIGGEGLSAGNLISGNALSGVMVVDPNTNGNRVLGNLIGITSDGRTALGNGQNGVQVGNGAQFNEIGGTLSSARNVIASNGRNGLAFLDANTQGNRALGNYIGTDVTGNLALGNTEHGVRISGGAQSNVIGDTSAGAGNLIRFNTLDGIAVLDPATTGNRIRGNRLRENDGLAINLSGGTENLGVTANDDQDADTGPNNLQNYPVITEAVDVRGTTTIKGALNSTPSTTFDIDLYVSVAPDASNHGEAEAYAGSVAVTTDSAGNGTFQVAVAGPYFNQVLSATATNLDTGDTSELGRAFFVTRPPEPQATLTLNPASVQGGAISKGRVTLDRPVEDGSVATITLTNDNPLIATAPASLTIPAGSVFVEFDIATTPVSGVSTAVISAQYGTSLSSVTLNVLPPPPPTGTVLALAPAAGKIGDTIPLEAALTSGGVGLAGKQVAFFVEGAQVGTAVTGADGKAVYNYTIPAALGLGVKSLTATFAGDGTYAAANGTAALTVQAATPPPPPGTAPFDTNDDWRVSIGEATAYGLAWKQGSAWAKGPNPIPIRYVTNAGMLWKQGETYHVEAPLDPPWVPGAAGRSQPGGGNGGGGASGRPLTAARSIRRMGSNGAGAGTLVEVTIRVLPSSGTDAYALEETLPNGWTLDSASDQSKVVGGALRWGPFLDNKPRNLRYRLVAAQANRGRQVKGVASADGGMADVTGPKNLPDR